MEQEEALVSQIEDEKGRKLPVVVKNDTEERIRRLESRVEVLKAVLKEHVERCGCEKGRW